jgi:hypothetical protein
VETENLIHELATRGQPIPRIERPFVRFLRWALFATLCVVAGVAAFGLRPDAGPAVRSPTFLLLAVLTLALGTSSALSAFMMSVPDRVQPWLFAVPATVLALGLGVLAGDVVSAGSPRAGDGITCVGKILALALLPSALLFHMLRKAAPLRLGGVGALAALSAVATGALGAQFMCRHDGPLHILLWHYVPVVLLSGVGILLGRLLLKWDR